MNNLKLQAGDYIRYLGSRSVTYNEFLEVGGTYVIKDVELDFADRVVYRFRSPKLDSDLLWHPQGALYPNAFEPVQNDVQATSLAHDDYTALLDLALDTNDSEWFYAITELMKEAEAGSE